MVAFESQCRSLLIVAELTTKAVRHFPVSTSALMQSGVIGSPAALIPSPRRSPLLYCFAEGGMRGSSISTQHLTVDQKRLLAAVGGHLRRLWDRRHREMRYVRRIVTEARKSHAPSWRSIENR